VDGELGRCGDHGRPAGPFSGTATELVRSRETSFARHWRSVSGLTSDTGNTFPSATSLCLGPGSDLISSHLQLYKAQLRPQAVYL
jgi:hypothetical protein